MGKGGNPQLNLGFPCNYKGYWQQILDIAAACSCYSEVKYVMFLYWIFMQWINPFLLNTTHCKTSHIIQPFGH